MQFAKPENQQALVLHHNRWKDCQRCPLHLNRHRICLWRGYIPCEVLFVGEGPGATEDLDGYPFTGPAGNLLDSMIADAIKDSQSDTPIIGITNLVACQPIGDDGKNRPPTKEESEACRPRLAELIREAQPNVVILVGKEVKANLIPVVAKETPKCWSILHPASLLREDRTQFTPLYQKQVTILVQAFESLIPF